MAIVRSVCICIIGPDVAQTEETELLLYLILTLYCIQDLTYATSKLEWLAKCSNIRSSHWLICHCFGTCTLTPLRVAVDLLLKRMDNQSHHQQSANMYTAIFPTTCYYHCKIWEKWDLSLNWDYGKGKCISNCNFMLFKWYKMVKSKFIKKFLRYRLDCPETKVKT